MCKSLSHLLTLQFTTTKLLSFSLNSALCFWSSISKFMRWHRVIFLISLSSQNYSVEFTIDLVVIPDLLSMTNWRTVRRINKLTQIRLLSFDFSFSLSQIFSISFSFSVLQLTHTGRWSGVLFTSMLISITYPLTKRQSAHEVSFISICWVYIASLKFGITSSTVFKFFFVTEKIILRKWDHTKSFILYHSTRRLKRLAWSSKTKKISRC